jgi:hypothetical protein
MRATPTISVAAGTFHCAPAGAAASGTITATGATGTPNAIGIPVGTITAALAAGYNTNLVGGGGSGYILASADL